MSQEGEDEQPTPSREVTGYRTPRYPVFVVSGAVLGLLAGIGLALFGGSSTAVGGSGVVGFFAAFGTLLGALVGGTVAVLAETLLNRGRGRRRR